MEIRTWWGTHLRLKNDRARDPWKKKEDVRRSVQLMRREKSFGAACNPEKGRKNMRLVNECQRGKRKLSNLKEPQNGNKF